jgi:hypothetical protein
MPARTLRNRGESPRDRERSCGACCLASRVAGASGIRHTRPPVRRVRGGYSATPRRTRGPGGVRVWRWRRRRGEGQSEGIRVRGGRASCHRRGGAWNRMAATRRPLPSQSMGARLGCANRRGPGDLQPVAPRQRFLPSLSRPAPTGARVRDWAAYRRRERPRQRATGSAVERRKRDVLEATRDGRTRDGGDDDGA